MHSIPCNATKAMQHIDATDGKGSLTRCVVPILPFTRLSYLSSQHVDERPLSSMIKCRSESRSPRSLIEVLRNE